jgi:hypothetical protein
VLVAALLIAVALAGAAIAWAATGSDDDEEDGPPALTVPSGTVTLPPITGTLPVDPSVTLPTGSFPTFPTTFPTVIIPPSPTPPAGGFSSDWPDRAAFTAILSSVRSRSEAEARRDRVRATGQPAGVLFSSDHDSLRPGYYVVFSGVFSTRAQAAQQARALRGANPGAYPARVSAP